MLNTTFILIGSLFLLLQGATIATRYAVALAEDFHLSKYTIGFIVVSVISIIPETLIVIQSAYQDVPSLALGMLFGSNITDLTIVFGVIIFMTGRSLKIEGKILKNHIAYPFILLLPIILGLNGNFSRLEGLALIVAGGVFYYLALRDGVDDGLEPPADRKNSIAKNASLLAVGVLLLLVGSYFTVEAAADFAEVLGVSTVLIGILVVGLGTSLPEFSFSLKSVKQNDDSLAVGDLLGTVLADATIVLGMLALITPFSFPREIVLITGTCMILSSFMLFYFMGTGHRITKKEGAYLILLWIAFVLISFFTS